MKFLTKQTLREMVGGIVSGITCGIVPEIVYETVGGIVLAIVTVIGIRVNPLLYTKVAFRQIQLHRSIDLNLFYNLDNYAPPL